jgi:hypothetical protein
MWGTPPAHFRVSTLGSKLEFMDLNSGQMIALVGYGRITMDFPNKKMKTYDIT